MRPKDTSPESHRAQLDTYRRMGANARLALALSMSDDLRAVTEDGVRGRHPDYDERAVQTAVLQLSLGVSAFRAAFPERMPVAP